MPVPLEEEITDPFNECAFTVQQSYQVYVIAEDDNRILKLTSITASSLARMLLEFGDNEVGDAVLITFTGNKFTLRDEGRNKDVRIFKEASGYEPGMLRGGRRHRRTRKHRHSKKGSRRGK
jgi:hypothetical protein